MRTTHFTVKHSGRERVSFAAAEARPVYTREGLGSIATTEAEGGGQSNMP